MTARGEKQKQKKPAIAFSTYRRSNILSPIKINEKKIILVVTARKTNCLSKAHVLYFQRCELEPWYCMVSLSIIKTSLGILSTTGTGLVIHEHYQTRILY